MFADEIRRAVEAAPRVELAKIGEALWKAWGQGLLGDDEAQRLADQIEVRRALPRPERPPQRRIGSRPRSAASMERRRSWAAAGRLPPALASRFTLAEQAVLAVVAAEVVKGGACELTLEHVAALAGVCRKTVKNALREAHALGLARVEERRLTAWRSLPNRITIISSEWSTWLRMARRGGGGKSVPPTNTQRIKSGVALPRDSFILKRPIQNRPQQPKKRAFGKAGAFPEIVPDAASR